MGQGRSPGFGLGWRDRCVRSTTGSFPKPRASFSRVETVVAPTVLCSSGSPVILMFLWRDLTSRSSQLLSRVTSWAKSLSTLLLSETTSSVHVDRGASMSFTVNFSTYTSDQIAAMLAFSSVFTLCSSDFI